MAQMFSGYAADRPLISRTTNEGGFLGEEPVPGDKLHHIPGKRNRSALGYCGYIPHVYPGNLFGKTYGVITSSASMKSRDGGIFFEIS